MAECSSREARKSAELRRILLKEEERTKFKTVRKILRKQPWDRTEQETNTLKQLPEVCNIVQSRMEKRHSLKERIKELIDPPEVLNKKCDELAQVISQAKSLVIYTGAGISTAAQIPDYRGPDGVWTRLQKGEEVRAHDLSSAEPTYTHMAITELHKQKIVSHVVSQNCDGLHLRSGLPRTCLSEVHGNMYIEVCSKCKPLHQYFRLFDVTEHTALHKHKTGRKCHRCKSELIDTIVHFGERGSIRWPLNWRGAGKAADKADIILCLGSSLKVLKRYTCLWCTDKVLHKRPKLYIVNLQWTPKDHHATIKIHGKCDDVMRRVMQHLKWTVPKYCREKDPLFLLATPLQPGEEETKTTSDLLPAGCDLAQMCTVDANSNALHHLTITLEHNYAKLTTDLKKEDVSISDIESENECDKQTVDIYSSGSNHSVSPCPTNFCGKDNFATSISTSDLSHDTDVKKNCLSMPSISTQNFDETNSRKEVLNEASKPSGWFGKGYAKWKKRKRKKMYK